MTYPIEKNPFWNLNEHIDSLQADGAQEPYPTITSARFRTVGEHPPIPIAAIFPSFYAAVHRAVNVRSVANGDVEPFCTAPEWRRYQADEHACYPLAGELRVQLHAAGIRLSNDGNGSEPSRDVYARLERPTPPDEDAIRAMLAYYEQPPRDGYTHTLGPHQFHKPAPKRSLFASIRRFFGLDCF